MLCVYRYLFSSPDPKHCVVRMTTEYFSKLGEEYTGLCVSLCSPRNGNLPSGRSLRYSNALQDFHFVLRKIGVDPTGYTEHSMRRGGASEAAKRGATIEEIRCAGGWTHVRVAAKYCQDRREHARPFLQYLQN